MTFCGHHGYLPFERQTGQRFVVDLTLSVDLRSPGRSDQLADTIDYGAVYGDVKRVVEGPPHFDLIESVAESVAQEVLARDERVAAVTVRVGKPQAPIRGGAILEELAVEVTRGRHPASDHP